jgi:hypothetical protein
MYDHQAITTKDSPSNSAHTQKMKTNITMKVQAVPNYRKRKSKKVERNIDLATHNQTLK